MRAQPGIFKETLFSVPMPRLRARADLLTAHRYFGENAAHERNAMMRVARIDMLGFVLEAVIVVGGLFALVMYSCPFQPSSSTVHLEPRNERMV
ncbi:MAG: hypothetical protein V1907_03740 [Candidatus Kerfeldbacteria bacterium]